MYWSSWGPVPLIEQANMDGSKRQIFLSAQVGRANGLTVDLTTARLYWTDLDGQSVNYAYLKSPARLVTYLAQMCYNYNSALRINFLSNSIVMLTREVEVCPRCQGLSVISAVC